MKLKSTYLLAIIFITLFESAFSQGNVNYGLQIMDGEDHPKPNLKVVATETSTLVKVQGTTDADGKLMLHLKNGKEWVFNVGEIKRAFFTTAVSFSIVDMEDVYVYDLDAHARKVKQNFTRTDDGFTIIKQSYSSTDNIPEKHCMLASTIIHPTNGNKLPNVKVRLVNLRDNIIYETSSKRNGEATFIVPNNTEYDIDLNNLKNFGSSDFGDEYTKNSLELYFAPTLVNEKVINDTIHQFVTNETLASSDRALVKLNIQGGKKNGKKETVYLRDYKTGKTYTTQSKPEGYALFLVPIHTVYMVDFRYQQNADAVNLKYAKGITDAQFNAYYSPDPKLEYPENFIPNSENLILKSYKDFLTKQFEKPINKPFSLKIRNINKINENSKEALFKVTLAASNAYGKGTRIPANVAFVLDKSGSMYGANRADALKKSLWDIGNSLNDGDYVSVTLFDSDAVVVQNSKENHLLGFETIIENYNPSGGTNIYEGIQVASASLLKKSDPSRSNRIILLTDGYGSVSPETITNLVSDLNAKGIDFSTIGLGKSYNQSLLQLIALKGNGTFNGVENSDSLTSVFLEQVKGSLLYTVTDLKVKIFHDEKLVYSNMLGYKAQKESDKSLSFDVPYLPQTTNEIGFLKFNLDSSDEVTMAKPLKMKVSYFDLSLNKTIKYEEQITLEWTNETDTALKLDQEEKKLFGIAILNQTLKLMAQANDNKDLKTARKVLKDGIKQIENIFPDAKPKEILKLLKEVKKYTALFKQMELNGD